MVKVAAVKNKNKSKPSAKNVAKKSSKSSGEKRAKKGSKEKSQTMRKRKKAAALKNKNKSQPSAKNVAKKSSKSPGEKRVKKRSKEKSQKMRKRKKAAAVKNKNKSQPSAKNVAKKSSKSPGEKRAKKGSKEKSQTMRERKKAAAVKNKNKSQPSAKNVAKKSSKSPGEKRAKKGSKEKSQKMRKREKVAAMKNKNKLNPSEKEGTKKRAKSPGEKRTKRGSREKNQKIQKGKKKVAAVKDKNKSKPSAKSVTRRSSKSPEDKPIKKVSKAKSQKMQKGRKGAAVKNKNTSKPSAKGGTKKRAKLPGEKRTKKGSREKNQEIQKRKKKVAAVRDKNISKPSAKEKTKKKAKLPREKQTRNGSKANSHKMQKGKKEGAVKNKNISKPSAKNVTKKSSKSLGEKQTKKGSNEKNRKMQKGKHLKDKKTLQTTKLKGSQKKQKGKLSPAVGGVNSKKKSNKKKAKKNPRNPSKPRKASKKEPGLKRFVHRNRKRVLITALIVILLALLVVFVIFGIFTGLFGKLPAVLCDSPNCKRASEFLKKSAMFSVDPCTDFYEHVCGNYSGKSSIQQETRFETYQALLKPLSNKNITSSALDKFKKFYKTCIEDGGPSLKDIAIEFMHGTPTKSLQDAIIYLLKLTNNIGVFNLAPLPYTNPKTNKTFYKLVVTPSLQYLNYANADQFEHDLTETVSEFYKEVYDKLPDQLLEKFVQRVMAVAHGFISAYVESNFASNELEKPVNSDEIDWNDIATALSPRGSNLYDRIFSLKGYTQILNQLIDKHSKNSIIDFMKFAWYKGTIIYSFNRSPESIRQQCDITVISHFSGALAYFQFANDSIESKDGIFKIAEKVKNSFADLVEDSSWIDEKTKERAVNKIEKIEFRDVYLMKDQVERLYSSLDLNTTCFFFEVMKSVQKWKIARTYHLIADVKHEELVVLPVVIDGAYVETGNLMYFMLGFNTLPKFDGDLPVFFNYGSAGYFMGQQMGHSMGPRLYSWDTYANEEELSKSLTGFRMNKNLECVRRHYERNWRVVADLNLEEHTSDFISSKAAFLAMKKISDKLLRDTVLPGFEEKTNEQMFFYSHAATQCESRQYRESLGEYEKHLSGRARVNGPFSMNTYFAEAFGCKRGSKMNSVERCEYY